MEGLLDKGIVELRSLLTKKEITSVELTRFYLERIKKHDDAIRSYLRRPKTRSTATVRPFRQAVLFQAKDRCIVRLRKKLPA